jgi:hypothetical protein
MATASEEVDRLITTTLQAWGRVQSAWLQALNDVWLAVQDAAPVETNVYGINQTEVEILAQPNDTSLVVGPLTMTTGGATSTIAPERVTISPLMVAAGVPTTAVVTVTPAAGTTPGTYEGTVHDAAGTMLSLLWITVTAPPE